MLTSEQFDARSESNGCVAAQYKKLALKTSQYTDNACAVDHPIESAHSFSAMISRTVGVTKIEAGSCSASSTARSTSAAHASLRTPSSTSRGALVRTKPAGQFYAVSPGRAAKAMGRADRMEKPRSTSNRGSIRATSGSPPCARQLSYTAATNSVIALRGGTI